MISNTLKIALLFILICGNYDIAAENEFRIYSVIRGHKLFITNYDVKEFIQLSTLSDSAMINLFNANNKDYNAYHAALANYTKARYNDGIKKLGYIKMVERYATRHRDNKKWKAFRVTEKEYYEKIDQREDEALGELLKEANKIGKGIVYVREQFGKRLKEAGFPHFAGRTNTEIYFDWYDLQKKRIKLDFLLREVTRFERVATMKPKYDSYVPARAVYDFMEEVAPIVENKFSGQRLRASEAQMVLEGDTRLPVMIKELSFLSPDSTNLATLKERAPGVFSDFIEAIDESIIPELRDNLASDISRYESIALKFANTYSRNELQEKATENQNLFVSKKGDHRNLMLARLYELAMVAKTSEAQKSNSTLSQYAGEAINASIQMLNDKDFVIGSADDTKRLRDRLVEKLRNASDQKSLSDYEKSAQAMARWVIKFQIKKTALEIIPQAMVTLHDSKEWETIKRVEKYQERQEFEKDLKTLKQREMLNYFDGIITLNLDGNGDNRSRADLAKFFE